MDDTVDLDGLIDGLIEREGGYVANPADKGGRSAARRTVPSSRRAAAGQ